VMFRGATPPPFPPLHEPSALVKSGPVPQFRYEVRCIALPHNRSWLREIAFWYGSSEQLFINNVCFDEIEADNPDLTKDERLRIFNVLARRLGVKDGGL